MNPSTTPARARLRLITTFGLGYCKPASGTWGSLPPLFIAAGLVGIGLQGSFAWYLTLAGLLVVFSWACLAQGDLAEAVFGKKDPGQVVADETAGMALTLLFIPPSVLGTWPAAAAWLLAAFFIWRIADIVKPWPANALQRIPGGLGILIDDLVAALYAGLAMLAMGLIA
jgi:phosphatidylglycerophosphatase A